jgi:hypothetical protein
MLLVTKQNVAANHGLEFRVASVLKIGSEAESASCARVQALELRQELIGPKGVEWIAAMDCNGILPRRTKINPRGGHKLHWARFAHAAQLANDSASAG